MAQHTELGAQIQMKKGEVGREESECYKTAHLTKAGLLKTLCIGTARSFQEIGPNRDCELLKRLNFALLALLVFPVLGACSPSSNHSLASLQDQCKPSQVDDFFEGNPDKRGLLAAQNKLSDFFSSFRRCEYELTVELFFTHSRNGPIMEPYNVKIQTINQTELAGCVSWTSIRAPIAGEICFEGAENG